MKIGILGCGLIGRKRGGFLKGHQLVGVFDPDQVRSKSLADDLATLNFSSSADLIGASDLMIIATSNHVLAELTRECVLAGKHVLVEKPGGIRVQDLEEIKKISNEKKCAVKVGFNHRFHPALLKTRALIDEGQLGELMFLRARYGHGGRLGYEKEWRAVPDLGGGGELMDQGVHLLDLVYWFMGPLPLQSSYVTTSFWDMMVDDNAVLTLAEGKKWATFHVSCSEWKNTFGLEIYGRTGKVFISGLGRSYGTETLTYYKMLPQMGPPEIQEWKFTEDDRSWELDLQNLIDHIEKKTPLWGDVDSALYSLRQVTEAYRQNKYLDLPGTRP
jgi:predicted dehydrogenase